MQPGILIPILNIRGQICGIQLRRDNYSNHGKYVWVSSAKRNYGTSSGAPLHWSRPKLLASASEVLLTEGALKADVISYFLSVPIIAAAGVGLFGREFGAKLKTNYPNITAVIGIDSDWRTKPQVKAALMALQRQLTAAGLTWKMRLWSSQHKGYDDYLLAEFSNGLAA